MSKLLTELSQSGCIGDSISTLSSDGNKFSDNFDGGDDGRAMTAVEGGGVEIFEEVSVVVGLADAADEVVKGVRDGALLLMLLSDGVVGVLGSKAAVSGSSPLRMRISRTSVIT